MNHSHPGVAHLGSLGPIGVVAAPGPGGPVGIGIGVPIMTASPMISHKYHIAQMQHHHQKKLVSPDSSDDKDTYVAQLFTHRSSPPTSLQTSSSCGNPLTWTNPLLQSSAGMGYPVMGMSSMMGSSGSQGLSDASILYGLIGTAGNGPNLNISNSGVNIASQSSIINIPISSPSPVTTGIISNSNGTAGNSSVTDPTENQSTQPAKEIIHCKACTLFPPNPSAPLPTTRDKPPGCRTVFVGGLPENITEEIIREIFDRCGEIITIRMSKKNFCHIRFELEHCIETAVFLSGYRIRIGSNSDPPNIGRLHVDYAQARDDQFEFECRQRQLLREQRHRERIEQERLLPPLCPPAVSLYSDHEASIVAEKIKSDDTFIKGIHIVVGWLDRGDCIKRNSNCFYSMIQSTNSHVRRLLNEKSQYDDELQKAKDLMRQRVTGLLMQFSQIEKVFVSACQKKAWDHFSKAQRKNIEMWRKQATEIKGALLEEALAERNDEEMDLSDCESEINQQQCENHSPECKKPRMEEMAKKAVHQLKEENDALRCQLEASSNEVDLMKADLKTEMDAKDFQLKALQKQLMELQNSIGQQITSIYERSGEKSCSSTTITMPNLEQSLKDNAGYCDSSSTSVVTTVAKVQNNNVFSGADDNQRIGANNTISITETHARLIGVISTFLHVHPFGASLDYIWSYIQSITVLPNIRPSELELLLTRFPTLFKQEVSGIGASLERKWVFIGFS